MITALTNLFKYRWLRLQHPELCDFLDMGFGIEARRKRCEPYWKRHLEYCRSFIRDELIDGGKGLQVAVLGAGRCYDIDLEWSLAQMQSGAISEMDLFDADPACLSTWKKLTTKFQAGGVHRDRIGMHLMDLSASLLSWTTQLRELLRSKPQASVETLTGMLQSLTVEPAKLPKSYDRIISLNLLSQIPIYWRDRVHAEVKKAWSLDTDPNGRYPASLQAALEHSMARLQEQHLELLGTSGAAKILLITDRAFFYLTADHHHWQEERALWFEGRTNIPGYTPRALKEWYWNIAPQGVEQKDYGVVHQIDAVASVKLNAAR